MRPPRSAQSIPKLLTAYHLSLATPTEVQRRGRAGGCIDAADHLGQAGLEEGDEDHFPRGGGRGSRGAAG